MSDEMVSNEFGPSPGEQAKRWGLELKAAQKSLEEWHKAGERIIRRFLDERESRSKDDTRWNLFSANVTTLRAMLYGKPPQVTVTRRWADSQDDVARVAGEMMERLLNADIEDDEDGYTDALQHALDDRLLPGFGIARVRYEAEFEDVGEVPAKVDEDGSELAPAVPAHQRKLCEDVDVDYYHWRDVLWSPARVWGEVRWVAFASDMSRGELIERFGEEVGRAVPLQLTKRDEGKEQVADPWARAKVWEIWSEEDEKVYWFVEGYPVILDEKEDPLGLEGFFPCPRPMIANATTTAFRPRPDYVLAQDLYDEVDAVCTRITALERAIKVRGVYDKASPEVKRLLREGEDNDLIPVDNWAMFAEKGGMNGIVDWFPLESVVSALTSLRDYRSELIDALYQVTGMSDIMRGQAATAGTSATEQAIKAKFGSVRVQALQDDFARFASELQALRAELIRKLYEPETIIKGSNVERTPDAQLAAQALELLKSEDFCLRVEVKPEAVSLTDFAALKGERMELLTGLATFLQAAAPLAQQMPSSTPFLLQILQWTIAGFKGSSQIEGVLDQAIAAAQAAAQQPQAAQQPDPKLLVTQMKVQGDLQKEQAKLQADLTRTQAEVQADAQRERNQREQNVLEAAQKAQIQAAGRMNRPGGNGVT